MDFSLFTKLNMSKKNNFEMKIGYSNNQSDPRLNLQVSEGKKRHFLID